MHLTLTHFRQCHHDNTQSSHCPSILRHNGVPPCWRRALTLLSTTATPVPGTNCASSTGQNRSDIKTLQASTIAVYRQRSCFLVSKQSTTANGCSSCKTGRVKESGRWKSGRRPLRPPRQISRRRQRRPNCPDRSNLPLRLQHFPAWQQSNQRPPSNRKANKLHRPNLRRHGVVYTSTTHHTLIILVIKHIHGCRKHPRYRLQSIQRPSSLRQDRRQRQQACAYETQLDYWAHHPG